MFIFLLNCLCNRNLIVKKPEKSTFCTLTTHYLKQIIFRDIFQKQIPLFGFRKFAEKMS
jgi:hypothetical protein